MQAEAVARPCSIPREAGRRSAVTVVDVVVVEVADVVAAAEDEIRSANNKAHRANFIVRCKAKAKSERLT
jgi:hypothetical protein